MRVCLPICSCLLCLPVCLSVVSVCLFVRVCRFLVYRFFVFWFCLSGDVCLLFCLSVCECLPGFQSAVVCLSVVGLSFSLSGRVCLYVDVHPNVSVFLSAYLLVGILCACVRSCARVCTRACACASSSAYSRAQITIDPLASVCRPVSTPSSPSKRKLRQR